MPTSAYKDGALKKNPLLGTATYSVDSRAQQKERLMGLYGEAKPLAGQGRAGMEGILASRHARFAEADQAALGGLQSQYAGLQNQASSLRDATKEKQLAGDIDKYGYYSKKKSLSKKRRAKLTAKHDSAVAERAAYETNIAENVKRLQGEGNIHAAEFDRRAGALQQRIDDYNLFLGSY